MNYGESKIKNFTDLKAWQYGHQLVLAIYKITKNFPPDEKFALTDQIRRASVSVTSNIAEGFSRKSAKEKSQFYSMALGSLTEVQNQILIARDVGYLRREDCDLLAEKTIIVSKLTNGLIKGVLTRNP